MSQDKDSLESSSGDQVGLADSSEAVEGGDAVSANSNSQPEDQPEEKASDEMTLTEHLNELRKRLIRSFIAVFVGFLACYAFAEQLFDILMEPMVRVLHNSNFIYTYPPEAFFTYLKVSFVAGFFLVSPYLFYQVWLFVAPGLYQNERKYLVPIAIFSAVFFTVGALFGYFVVFPFGFEFFASYSTDKIVFTPKLSEYLSFALKLLFAFGVVFELPLVIFFLARLGLVTAQGLRRVRKYAILVIFIVAAILTPPDVFTQTLMAGPMILLYEFGIIAAHLFGKEKKKPAADEDEEKSAEAE
ncbi:Sec-independent protein translocase TatC [Desulfocurvibacter africanus PCS]|uniref:Sec-independent protein translocase protein TatC n=2 Tax=Desulfocurvibacter africanus TaxID=873 RepID=M5PTI5_DESAF|nr:twin-arginine translocase subunit TatC [Desulfocurvibacter africanus]EMG37662.1 Sec-independent protein translocase TatC [Desulfocurvibacter africanus PCS]